MSRFMVMLLASVVTGGALLGAAGSAQAQGYVEVYAGDVVQVYAGGGWSQATVLDVSGNSALVRYLDPAWGDAWVDVSQLSVSGGVQGGAYQPAIQVYWGSQWYDGTLLARRGDRYHVRYRGVSEWVGAERWHHRGGRSSRRGDSVGRRDHGGGRPAMGHRERRHDDRGGVRGNHRDNDRGGVRGNHRDNDRGGRHGKVRDGSRGGHDRGSRNRGRQGDGRRGGGRGRH